MPAPRAAADHTPGIIVQRQVGARVSSPHPAIHAVTFPRQGFPHNRLGRFTIGPRGGRRDIPFVREPFAQFVVRACHVARQRVPAPLFISRKIVTIGCASRFSTGLLALLSL